MILPFINQLYINLSSNKKIYGENMSRENNFTAFN